MQELLDSTEKKYSELVYDITKVIRERRSIKPDAYSGEVIDRTSIELMLENAHWAPNHGKTEPWYFIVYAGEGRKRLGEAHATLYKKFTPEESFKQKSYEKLAALPQMASHVIVICMRRGSKKGIPEIEEVEAVACAVQNLHLTATALGLVGYWSSGGMTYHPALRSWLGLREEDRCLGFFYVGKSEPILNVPGKRFADFHEKIQWIEE